VVIRWIEGPNWVAGLCAQPAGRLCHFGPDQETNLLYWDEATAPVLGGVRVWVAPEQECCYFPEQAGEFFSDGDWIGVRDESWVGMTRWVMACAEGDSLRIRGAVDGVTGLGAWLLAVFQGPGVAHFDLPEKVPFAMDYRAAVPLTLWRYTDFMDPRLALSSGRVSLRQGGPGRQKIGGFSEKGEAVYETTEWRVRTRFGAEKCVPYPDFGTNVQLYTDERFLEVEALGPMVDGTAWVEMRLSLERLDPRIAGW